MIRGHLKIITLKAIAEDHDTGYGIIKYLGEKTGRKPSYGSMYPLLEQLEKEGLINTKEKDKKKIHKLTTKGKEHLRQMLEQKEQILSKLEEGMKVMCMMMDKKSGELHTKLIKRLQAGEEVPLLAVPAIEDLKKTLLEKILNNPNKTQLSKINKVIKETNKRLKAIK